MRKFVPLLLVLLLATAAYAQTNKSRIIGTVSTAEGAVIPGVRVTISSPALIGTSRTTNTNERGMYRFMLLPLGAYSIKLEREGYKAIEQDGIVLPFDSTVTINKVMEPSEFEEVITITGEAPIVDKTSSSFGDQLDTDFLENMPNLRDIWDMPNLSAGFSDDSALGAPERAGNALTQDGVVIHDPSTKTVFARVNFEAVEQVDVAMFGAPAEYHSFTGATINVVTKSGGNEFHGEVNYFHQDIDWISDNTEKYRDFGFSAPSGDDIMDPNFAFGGPVLHDRLWFFGTHNYSKEKHQEEILTGVINADYIPTIWSVKFTGRWDNRNQTSFSYTDYYRDRPYRVAHGSWRQQLDGSMYAQVSEGRTWLLLHSFVLNNDIVLEGRYSKFKGGFSLTGRNEGGTYRDWDTGDHLPIENPDGTLNKKDIYDRPRDTLLGTVNYFNDDLYGNHSMKFGVEYERGVTGTWRRYNQYYWYRDGDPYRWYDYSGIFNARTVVYRMAGFGQDSWSLSERLTVNLGFRFDRWWSKSGDPNSGGLAGSDTFRTYFDPVLRLGVAYDLFGDGKTIARAFYGRYYEGVTGGNVRPLVTAIEPERRYRWENGQWVLYSESGGTQPGAYELDEDHSNQYTEGIMVAVEREITPNIGGSVSFIYKKDRDIVGVMYPNGSWEEGTVSFSNENGSYSGVYYFDYVTGNPEVLTNPRKGDHGVLGDVDRDYYALVFTADKRMSDNWSLKGSYTFSRTNSPTLMYYGVVQGYENLSNPNDWVNFENARSELDRPHVLKLSGTYIAPFHVFVSPVFTWMSGTPLPTYYRPSGQDYDVLIKPLDGSDRYDSQLNVDLRLEKSFVLFERYRAGVILDIFNLTNSDYIDGNVAYPGYRSRRIESSAFGTPSVIADARIYQLGVRLLF